MARLTAFNFTTLNGYFKGPDDDISWNQHNQGEENDYAKEGANSGSTLIFGRVTYEMMARYWPSPDALKNNPVVAKGMNESEKIVFSRTLQKADWHNTRIIKNNMLEEMKKLKQQSGKSFTILGSGSIVSQLAEAGLVDEYQIMLNPVALGDGATLFKGIQHPLQLKLTSHRVFKCGAVLLSYEPA